jgi:hypothetical protein
MDKKLEQFLNNETSVKSASMGLIMGGVACIYFVDKIIGMTLTIAGIALQFYLKKKFKTDKPKKEESAEEVKE